MSEILRVDKVNYKYDGKFQALSNVSATFHKGEIVAVLGGNGAGKSTFFLCCNGVLHPQSGKIFLHGMEVAKSKKDAYSLRQAVGLVFQDSESQIIASSVESEVSFGPMNLKLAAQEVASRVDYALSQMNLQEFRDYAPHYLSGGEKRRVGIAGILAMRPEILLLDEPTTSLDPCNVDALENTLHMLNSEGMAIVISTHDVNFAYKIAKRAIVFAKGEIIADGEVGEVFASQDVLVKAGLKKPLLYEAYEHIKGSNAKGSLGMAPRTIEEFREMVDITT